MTAYGDSLSFVHKGEHLTVNTTSWAHVTSPHDLLFSSSRAICPLSAEELLVVGGKAEKTDLNDVEILDIATSEHFKPSLDGCAILTPRSHISVCLPLTNTTYPAGMHCRAAEQQVEHHVWGV